MLLMELNNKLKASCYIFMPTFSIRSSFQYHTNATFSHYIHKNAPIAMALNHLYPLNLVHHSQCSPHPHPILPNDIKPTMSQSWKVVESPFKLHGHAHQYSSPHKANSSMAP